MISSEISLVDKGLISRNDVSVKVEPNSGLGIRFILPSSKIIQASSKNIFSSQRNTVIGDSEEALCLVEHFLAACVLMDIDDIDVHVDNLELPFGDGSAELWINFFKNTKFASSFSVNKRIDLKEEFIIFDDIDHSRFIKVKPSNNFSVTYILDMPNTVIGKQEANWTLGVDPIKLIAQARTFSNEEENKLLGLDGWVLGYSEEGFSKDLHHHYEPAYHKALDLIGDLRLAEFNPLRLNAHIISSKAGHALNAKLANYLREMFVEC